MKKFCTFFAMFVLLSLCVEARNVIKNPNEISSRKAYNLYNPHFTTYAVYSPQNSDYYVWTAGMIGDAGHAVKNPKYSEPFDSADRNGAWMFVTYNDGLGNFWYAYNLGAKKFLCVGYGSNAETRFSNGSTINLSIDDGLAHIARVGGGRNYMCVSPQLNYPISIWSIDDAGASWEIIENDKVEVTDEDYNNCMEMLDKYVPKYVRINVDTRNGNIFASKSGGEMPSGAYAGTPITFAAQALKGFTCPEGIAIRHGHNLDGPQYVDGERQWGEYTVPMTTNNITIPADSVDGDILIKAYWEQTSWDGYELVFSDEFNGDGQPDPTKWMRTKRQNATWNRWCSDSPLVVNESDGSLKCLAIPNPDKSVDNADMLTGGIQSYFGFRYGRVEARIKTNPWVGSFPAFWMMPVDNSKGWPNAGEIDIWEMIDYNDVSYHTVHTNWTYNLGKGGNSKSKSNVWYYDSWHVFAVEWTDKKISWYVDGQFVWSYNKSTDANALSNGQWPFDAPFYLILNQSVGNGSWAANADVEHTYSTEFDWVRVYQTTDITAVEDSLVDTPDQSNARPGIFDLSGRPVEEPQKGVYIVNGQKMRFE